MNQSSHISNDKMSLQKQNFGSNISNNNTATNSSDNNNVLPISTGSSLISDHSAYASNVSNRTPMFHSDLVADDSVSII